MGYGEGYIMGRLFGAAVGIIVGLLLIFFIKKDGRVRCRYDERQELIRGRGYKYAYYVMIACFIVDILFGEVLERFMERSVIGMIYLCIGVIVVSVYGILNDGYFSLNENPKRALAVFLGLFLINLASSLFTIRDGMLITGGRLTDSSLNIFCAVVLLIIILVILIKNVCRRRQEEG